MGTVAVGQGGVVTVITQVINIIVLLAKLQVVNRNICGCVSRRGRGS